MADVFWTQSTPDASTAAAATSYVPVRIAGAAADGSQDTFAQMSLALLLTSDNIGAGTVAQLMFGLAQANLLQTVLDKLSSDSTDPVRVQWDGRGRVQVGDTLAAWVQSTIGYTTSQMISLLGVAPPVTPPITGLSIDAFLNRIEALAAGNVDKLYLALPGSHGDPINIAITRAPAVYSSDAALASFVQSTLGISSGAYALLFA